MRGLVIRSNICFIQSSPVRVKIPRLVRVLAHVVDDISKFRNPNVAIPQSR